MKDHSTVSIPRMESHRCASACVNYLLPIMNCVERVFRLTISTASDIRTWFSNVEQHASEGVNKILIGNKCDWEEKRAVSTEQGQALADELGIPFLEVSAKSNINVDKAFYNLAADIKKRIIDTQKTEPQSQTVPIQEGGGIGNQLGGKCC